MYGILTFAAKWKKKALNNTDGASCGLFSFVRKL